MAISMLKIRRPLGRLIFNMGIAIPGKTVFLIETAPRILCTSAILATGSINLWLNFQREEVKKVSHFLLGLQEDIFSFIVFW